MRGLTERQRQILDWIVDSFRQRHRAPTYREMMVLMGATSLNAVHSHLRALQAKGYIRVLDGESHGIELVGYVPCPHCAGVGMVPESEDAS